MKPYRVLVSVLACVLCAPGLCLFAASPSPSSTPPACVDVQIGNDRTAYLNCINRGFERDVAREHTTPEPAAPTDARSSPTAVGTATESAARQRMGNSFGTSSTPQRPERVFVPPLPAPAH